MSSAGVASSLPRLAQSLAGELETAEAIKVAAKDYRNAGKIHEARMRLEALAAAVAESEAREKELVDAKDYQGAAAAAEEVRAAQSRLEAEEEKVRQECSSDLPHADDADGASTPATTSNKRRTWSSRFKGALHAGRSLLGTTDESRIGRLIDRPAATLDVTELEKLIGEHPRMHRAPPTRPAAYTRRGAHTLPWRSLFHPSQSQPGSGEVRRRRRPSPTTARSMQRRSSTVDVSLRVHCTQLVPESTTSARRG